MTRATVIARRELGSYFFSPMAYVAMFLFLRFLPMISIFEMRTLLPEAQAHAEGEGH